MNHPLQHSAMHNLNLLALFHNHMSQLLHDARHTIKEELPEDKAEALIRLYENDFTKKLSNSVFLMVFGHLEEMLLLLLQILEPTAYANSSGNKGLLARCKPMFNNILGNDPSNRNLSLQFISNAAKIRNALIHSSGRVDLFKSTDISVIVAAHPGSYEINLKRVCVTRQGLKDMVIHSRSLVEQLGRELPPIGDL